MESCGGQDRSWMILYLTGIEHFLGNYTHWQPTKSEKGGWVNGPALHPAATSLARYSVMTSGWSKADFQLSKMMLVCSPSNQCSHHIQCCGAAYYTMSCLDDLIGICGNYGDVVVTAPPELHCKSGCSCLQLQQMWACLQWGMCICPAGSCYSPLFHYGTIYLFVWVRWT